MGRFPLLWEGSFNVARAGGGGGRGDASGDADASTKKRGGGQSWGDALEVPARSLHGLVRKGVVGERIGAACASSVRGCPHVVYAMFCCYTLALHGLKRQGMQTEAT